MQPYWYSECKWKCKVIAFLPAWCRRIWFIGIWTSNSNVINLQVDLTAVIMEAVAVLIAKDSENCLKSLGDIRNKYSFLELFVTVLYKLELWGYFICNCYYK